MLDRGYESTWPVWDLKVWSKKPCFSCFLWLNLTFNRGEILTRDRVVVRWRPTQSGRVVETPTQGRFMGRLHCEYSRVYIRVDRHFISSFSSSSSPSFSSPTPFSAFVPMKLAFLSYYHGLLWILPKPAGNSDFSSGIRRWESIAGYTLSPIGNLTYLSTYLSVYVTYVDTQIQGFDCVTIFLNVVARGGTVRWNRHITPDLCLATSWLHDLI
jgi:hypothetical protein